MRNDYNRFRSEMRERLAANKPNPPAAHMPNSSAHGRPLVSQIPKVSSDQQLAEVEERLLSANQEDIKFQQDLVRKRSLTLLF